MSKIGWNGISFPFRTTHKGGVASSDTTYQNPSHLEESIVQILSTKKGERAMRPTFGSNIDYGIFDVTDVALTNMLKYEIKKAIDEQEPRVSVEMDDIEMSSNDNTINIHLVYTVVDFGTMYETNVTIDK